MLTLCVMKECREFAEKPLEKPLEDCDTVSVGDRSQHLSTLRCVLSKPHSEALSSDINIKALTLRSGL